MLTRDSSPSLYLLFTPEGAKRPCFYAITGQAYLITSDQAPPHYPDSFCQNYSGAGAAARNLSCRPNWSMRLSNRIWLATISIAPMASKMNGRYCGGTPLLFKSMAKSSLAPSSTIFFALLLHAASRVISSTTSCGRFAFLQRFRTAVSHNSSVSEISFWVMSATSSAFHCWGMNGSVASLPGGGGTSRRIGTGSPKLPGCAT